MEELKKIIEGYITTEQTDYAVLIKGSWGSGKTRFFKNQLSPNENGQVKSYQPFHPGDLLWYKFKTRDMGSLNWYHCRQKQKDNAKGGKNSDDKKR